MATQTIEFAAPSGQTISTVRLFAAGSDTVVDTAAATERTNSKLIYRAAFTDLPAGRYRLIAINSNSSPLAAYWVDTLAATGTYYAYDLTPTQVEDAVWDATQSAHTTAGTMGKTLDLLRKANAVVESTVLASPAPTATTFTVSGLAYPTGAFNKSVLWFANDASIAEQNSPIATFVNNGDGTQTITLQDPLTTAPTAGDGILIDPTSHVHTIAEIQSGLATLANQVVLIDGMGFVTSVLMGSISDAGTAAETYQITFAAATYTVDYSGLDATGNRSTTTRTKT